MNKIEYIKRIKEVISNTKEKNEKFKEIMKIANDMKNEYLIATFEENEETTKELEWLSN